MDSSGFDSKTERERAERRVNESERGESGDGLGH